MATYQETPYPESTPAGDLGTSPALGNSGPAAAAGAVNPTLERVVRGAHEAVDRFAEKAGPALERLRGSVGSTTESLKSRADQLSELEKQWAEDARSVVRQHPLAAVGVAIAAGLLIARLLK